jgi:cystathionine gamma-synthase
MPHLHTRLAHAGCTPDPATGAVVAPLHLATTYERAPDGSYPHGYLYSRMDNPTRADFEETMADLEGGATALAFASGMAAAQALLQGLRPGDRVLLPDDLYYGVRKLVDEVFIDWGLHVDTVDMTDLSAVEAALAADATRLVWLETPSNPLLKITDLKGVVERAHTAGAQVVVDGTWTTPVVQRPLNLGADVVLHSATKYLGGHSDLLGGALVFAENTPLAGRVRTMQQTGGAVMDPLSAWLALRGLRTLRVRLETMMRTAHQLATWLADHPRVTTIYYPGLPTHPGHAVAAKQMDGFGAMLSFEVKGTADDALSVAAGCTVFRRATSLGGTESLIEHRASIEPPDSQTPPSLIRCSIGLEHPDDLQEDLSRALGD